MSYDPNDWLTVAAAAKVKEVDPSTIRKAIAADEITATKVNDRLYIIRYRDLQHWSKSPRGRKSKKNNGG